MKKLFQSLSLLKTRTWLMIVAALSIIERVAVYLAYRPVAYHDTGGYRRAAEAILAGWSGLDGTRTPGYPAFMALIGSDERVYIAQLVLGLASTLLFFYIGWRISKRGWFGALAALAHTLNLGQLFFEANLISESLTTFFLAATLALMAWLLYGDNQRPPWRVFLMAGLAGVTAGLAALTRPLFVFLPVGVAAFLLLFWRKAGWKLRLGAALSAGLTGLLLVGMWVNFIHRQFGVWSVSSMGGYNLVQHTGLFFEYLPDQYAAVRDTYIQYRDARIAQTGAPGNAIWDAIQALEQVTGLGFIPLSNLMVKLSIQLILQHPFLYLRNVALGWLWFWKAPVYWAPATLSSPVLRAILSALVNLERGALVLFNLAFLLGSLGLLWKKVRRAFKMDQFLWFAVSSLWFTSILQTLLDHGDNPRFSVPIQTWVVLIALWWIINSINGRSHDKTPA